MLVLTFVSEISRSVVWMTVSLRQLLPSWRSVQSSVHLLRRASPIQRPVKMKFVRPCRVWQLALTLIWVIGSYGADDAVEHFSRHMPHHSVEDQKIPHILHQSWKTSTLPSAAHEVWEQTWKTENPGWHIMFWDDDQNRALVQHHYPWLLQVYDSLEGVYRADLVSVREGS